MIGALLIALVVIVALPLLFWATLGVVAGVLGQSLYHHAEETHPGSDLLETNV